MEKRVIFIFGCLLIVCAAIGCLSDTTAGKWFGVAMAAIVFIASRTRYGGIFSTACDEVIDALDTWLESLNKKS